MGVPSIGKRWGQGDLSGYAAGQLQAVFDLSKDLACCRLAVGYRHRFPFNSPLHHDNALTLELRTFIGFIDRAPPPTRVLRHIIGVKSPFHSQPGSECNRLITTVKAGL
jgi:hypothetical protein